MTDQERPSNLYEMVVADMKTKKELEIKRISEKYDSAIAAIAELMNAGATALVDAAINEVSGGGEIQISIGEFHGMPTTSATRIILERAKKPLRTDEIVKHIEKSGRKLEAANPAGNIYSSLKRNPDFELVAPNTWGLKEWYPGITRKAKPSRVEEIMREKAPISFVEADKQAQAEAEADVKE